MFVCDLQGFRTKKACIHLCSGCRSLTHHYSLLSLPFRHPLPPIFTFWTFPSLLTPAFPSAHRAVILACSSPPGATVYPHPHHMFVNLLNHSPRPLPFLLILPILGAVNGCRGNCILQWGTRTLVGATVTVLVLMENNAASSPPSPSVLSNHSPLATVAVVVFLLIKSVLVRHDRNLQTV